MRIIVLPLVGHFCVFARVDEDIEGACSRDSAYDPIVLNLFRADAHFSSMTGRNVTLAVI